MNMIYARRSVSVTELKRNLAGVVEAAAEGPIAILNHNRPEAYVIGSDFYENLIDLLEDMEDAATVQARSEEVPVAVTLDEL